VNERTYPYPMIRVSTFGRFVVECLSAVPAQGTAWPEYMRVEDEEWGGRNHRRNLLKLLVCSDCRRAPRDVLLELLWPDAEKRHADRYLNSAAWVLRRVLRTPGESSLLRTLRPSNDLTIYELADQEQLWVDADAFLDLLAEAERAERAGQDPLPWLEKAQELARGEFLVEDLYHAWADQLRQSVNAARHRCLHWLADLYEQRGMPGRAETLLYTTLKQDPADEDVLYRLMRVLASQGRAREALACYERTKRVLLREQQVQPLARTRELAEQIRNESIVLEEKQAYVVTNHVLSLHIENDLSQKGDSQNAPILSFTADQAALLSSLLELGDDAMAYFDPSKREALRQIAAAIGMAAVGSRAIVDPEAWERLSMTLVKPSALLTLDLYLVDQYTGALSRLLTKGEAQYVMHASQNLYNKLIQEYPSSRDTHLAGTQLRLGMLVGAAQEYSLPWYQRDQAVMQTYNHIEANVFGKVDVKNTFSHEYARVLAKRGRQYRVLWQFEECEKECEDGISSLGEIDDFSLRTHFLCERAHIEATRGDELLWMRKLEEARRGVLGMDLTDRERALNQVDYMQGEGYKRFAFHTQKELSMSMRERYAKRALDQFTQWKGATIELPGFEVLVAQVSKAQCLILLDPEEAIHLAGQLRKSAEQHYPALLDKIHRVVFLAQQRLQMSSSEFLQIFKEASQSAYHAGRNVL